MVAATLLLAALPLSVQDASGEPKAKKAAAKPKPAASKSKAEEYLRARRAFEAENDAYWEQIAAKRRIRIAKRRDKQEIALDDYVLTQPPIYSGPPRPPGYAPPRREADAPRLPPIPRVADFIKAAAEQFKFVPRRPESEIEFKRAYARIALAAGLTEEQAVGIYAFETGGNGGYDVQAGLTHPRPGSKPISPAVGYNQLLSTNSIGLLAAQGDGFVEILTKQAESLTGDERTAMDRKIEALRRMIAHSRTVPYAWAAHDRMAKFTPGGYGIHAAIVDRDIGPLLQTQKLLDSVLFARRNGRSAPLAAAELEMLNFTGDGNGFDMISMPLAFRDKVPTSNFFQPRGYVRNPIARRTGTVAALFAAMEGKMISAARQPGAQEMAAVFQDVIAKQARQ